MFTFHQHLRPGGASALRVLGQQRHPRERLRARGARVLLDVRVRLQMGPEIRSVGERPVAVAARKRFFASVCADVALQQPRSRERFAADRALTWQRVRPDVHLEGTERYVNFFTELATEGLLRPVAGGTVELAVFRQSGEGGVALAAVRALVSDAFESLLGQVFGVYAFRGRRRGRGVGAEGVLVHGQVVRRSEGQGLKG